MTEEQKMAIMAMLYAYEKVGEQYFSNSIYIPDRKDFKKGIDFKKAYNICLDMVEDKV